MTDIWSRLLAIATRSVPWSMAFCIGAIAVLNWSRIFGGPDVVLPIELLVIVRSVAVIGGAAPVFIGLRSLISWAWRTRGALAVRLRHLRPLNDFEVAALTEMAEDPTAWVKAQNIARKYRQQPLHIVQAFSTLADRGYAMRQVDKGTTMITRAGLAVAAKMALKVTAERRGRAKAQ